MVNEVHNDVTKQACRRREDLSSQHEDEVGEGSVGAMEKSRIHHMTFGKICTPSHLHFYYCHKICIHHTHAFYYTSCSFLLSCLRLLPSCKHESGCGQVLQGETSRFEECHLRGIRPPRVLSRHQVLEVTRDVCCCQYARF